MTREEVITKKVEGIKRDIEVLGKKIQAEAKKLTESVNLKSLEKLSEYKSQREKFAHAQFELYAVLGTSL